MRLARGISPMRMASCLERMDPTCQACVSEHGNRLPPCRLSVTLAPLARLSDQGHNPARASSSTLHLRTAENQMRTLDRHDIKVCQAFDAPAPTR